MKVTLAKHGGFAAGIRRPPSMVDSAELPDTAAAELAELVAAAEAAPDVSASHPGQARDVMSYTITVEEEDRQVVLTQSDTDMSPSFSTLLDWLERHATRRG